MPLLTLAGQIAVTAALADIEGGDAAVWLARAQAMLEALTRLGYEVIAV